MKSYLSFFISTVASKLAVVLFLSLFFVFPSQVSAQACNYTGQCVNNQSCLCISSNICFLTPSPCGSAIIGEVEPPQGVAEYNEEAGGEIGIFKFASRIINLASVIGGIIVMFNFITAGFTYVTSAGNAGAHEKVRDKLTWGLVGLAIIASFYLIAALIGVLFYGSSAAVLNPALGGALPE